MKPSEDTYLELLWTPLFPTKIGAAITDQIDSHPDLSYARYGERELQLDLFRPRSADRPLPAIVCIHGGGWQSGNRLNHGHLAKALARRSRVCRHVHLVSAFG